ncbi:MAG: hypothetical protein II685_02715, partial [Clostridia bacterium]|nr:hypothetical protein [Clostridia bacterium]
MILNVGDLLFVFFVLISHSELCAHTDQVGVGIRNIGQKAAKLLCEEFLTLDALEKAEREEISSIEGFGEV